jgi:hypothetical protein
MATGVIITKLYVERVPKGAKIVVRCGGCGSQTLKAKKTGTVTLPRFTGRVVDAGKKVEVRDDGSARHRQVQVGATGIVRTWTARPGAIKTQPDRCLNAKSSKIERCK